VTDHVHAFAREKSGLLRCWECQQEFTDIQALSYKRQLLVAYACAVCGEPAAYRVGERALCDFHVRDLVDKGVADVMRKKNRQAKPVRNEV